MYHPSLLAQGIEDVKGYILTQVETGLDEVLKMADSGAAQRDIEERLWQLVLPTAQLTMSSALSLQCRAVTEADIAARGLGEDQVGLRNEDDYWMTLTTTFGPVSFFSFAYRDSSSGAMTVTRTPARQQVFPLHRHCRSSELCLEWESRLGSEMPFRHAQQALSYFTHGAVAMEDTTIASHLLTVSRLVDREWLYQSPEKIVEVLVERATRDLETGKPIIYLSTDAHALRRYVDETWDARWKMANGLRLWCVDRRSGAIIHLGGEFTWGDCHVVAEIVDWLIDTGHVPADGDYGGGVVASVTVLTDGMPWIEDYMVSKFIDPVVILDAFHVMERLQKYADARFGKGSKQARALYAASVRLLFGKRPAKNSKRRKAAEKTDDVESQKTTSDLEGDGSQSNERPLNTTGLPACLILQSDRYSTALEVLLEVLDKEDVSIYAEDDHDKLLSYLKHNAYRMDYRRRRALGYQIGSGAMESLHRTGSQARLKIPGARWLLETSQALFNTRMLFLCGRWDEFWHQPGLHDKLVKAFSSKPIPAADQSDLSQDAVVEVLDAAA